MNPSELYHYPLKEYARDTIGRHLKADIDDVAFSELVLGLRDENAFCQLDNQAGVGCEPSIICSLGIIASD